MKVHFFIFYLRIFIHVSFICLDTIVKNLPCKTVFAFGYFIQNLDYKAFVLNSEQNKCHPQRLIKSWVLVNVWLVSEIPVYIDNLCAKSGALTCLSARQSLCLHLMVVWLFFFLPNNSCNCICSANWALCNLLIVRNFPCLYSKLFTRCSNQD